MATSEEVKEFLKKVIPYARASKLGKSALSLFLRDYGIAIKGVDINTTDMGAYLRVEFINGEEIEEARFDLAEVDGRPIEEIEKEAREENDSNV